MRGAPGRSPSPLASLFRQARREARRNLDLLESRAVFRALGIPMNRALLAATAEGAEAAARKLGGLVVLKIVAPEIVHKTDVGGVRVGVHPYDARREAAALIERVRRRAPGAHVRGVLVEEQVRGVEVIVGIARDPQFGPLLMFGVGGVFVEVYRDTVFRLAPLDLPDARAMIDEIRGRALLEGARGLPRVDKGVLAAFLRKVSRVPRAVPDIAEMDLNPVVITRRGPLAVDSRVVLTPA